jgi:16S rRNA (uracil1498-N3)-methyltransferase
LEYLSNIELYYCSSINNDEQSFQLFDEEYHHAIKVMRNKVGDKVYATDGNGKIYEGTIRTIEKKSLVVDVSKYYSYKNRLKHFTFCIPNLRNPDRFRFALEKCTELGITNFVFFNSERSVSKGFNLERINKILLSAMKQSLQSHLPKVDVFDSAKRFKDLIIEKILFEQNSENKLVNQVFDESKNYYLIFGPEGGFSEKEILDIQPTYILNIADNRLRSETAIIKVASILS